MASSKTPSTRARYDASAARWPSRSVVHTASVSTAVPMPILILIVVYDSAVRRLCKANFSGVADCRARPSRDTCREVAAQVVSSRPTRRPSDDSVHSRNGHSSVPMRTRRDSSNRRHAVRHMDSTSGAIYGSLWRFARSVCVTGWQPASCAAITIFDSNQAAQPGLLTDRS